MSAARRQYDCSNCPAYCCTYDHIEVTDTRSWDPRATRNSWLDISGSRHLPDICLRRYAGVVADGVMRRVRTRHLVCWVVPTHPVTVAPVPRHAASAPTPRRPARPRTRSEG